jgi:hypothetical protein
MRGWETIHDGFETTSRLMEVTLGHRAPILCSGKGWLWAGLRIIHKVLDGKSWKVGDGKSDLSLALPQMNLLRRCRSRSTRTPGFGQKGLAFEVVCGQQPPHPGSSCLRHWAHDEIVACNCLEGFTKNRTTFRRILSLSLIPFDSSVTSSAVCYHSLVHSIHGFHICCWVVVRPASPTSAPQPQGSSAH